MPEERAATTLAATSSWSTAVATPLARVPETDSLAFPQQSTIEHELYAFVSRHGGSISAEHGVGQLKRDKLYLSKSRAAIAYMERLKSVWDPHWVLNPGKVFARS